MQPVTLIANHKLHGSLQSVQDFIRAVEISRKAAPNVQVMLCPPSLYLHVALKAKSADGVTICAQSVSMHAGGAHTGEISAAMLADIGVRHTLVGHSEERARKHLSDDDVLQASLHAVHAGIVPVICIGESADDYASGNTCAALTHQLQTLQSVLATGAPMMLAYEPLWAIGSGKTPKINEIAEAHAHIHAHLKCTKEARDTPIPVLYGGSVKRENISEILAVLGVNGALIGSASLNSNDFTAMLHDAQRRAKGS